MAAPETIRVAGLKIVAMDPMGIGVIVPPAPQTAERVFAEHPDIMVAIDGPMFSVCSGQPDDYDRYQCGRVDYYLHDSQRGVHVSGRRDHDDNGVTFSLSPAGFTAARGNAPAPGATVAIQCYPGLVEEGRVAVSQRTSGPDSQANGRVAMGLLRDGRLFFAYARMSMWNFANALVTAGAVWAGYTDGGGSSSLVQRLANGTLEGSDADDPRGRRVPSWLVWRDPARSGGSAPPGSRLSIPTASYAVPGAIAGTALLLTYLYLRRKSVAASVAGLGLRL